MSSSEGASFRRWLAVVLWATVILLLSTDCFGGEQTGAVLLPLLHALFPAATPEMLETLHGLVRKAAHLSEYTVFGVLMLRALAPDDRPEPRQLWLTVLGGGLLAAVDEVQQAVAPGRTGSAVDVLIDLAGTVAGGTLAFYVVRWGLPLPSLLATSRKIDSRTARG